MIRLTVFVCSCVGILLAVVDAEAEADPYASNLIAIALNLRDSGIVRADIQKHIARLGDRAAIALIKHLGERGLTDPRNIRNFLPIIETAFVEPRFISMEADKRPQVTLFLLTFLQQKVPEIQEDIQKSISLVKSKTSEWDLRGEAPP